MRFLLHGAVFLLAAGCGGKASPTMPTACADDPSRAPDGGLLLAVGPFRLGLRSVTALTENGVSVTAVVFSEATDACAEVLSQAPSEKRIFVLTVPAGTVGAFPIGQDRSSASARVEHDCAPGEQPPSTSSYATSGLVTVSINQPPGMLAGKYDVTFPTGEQLTGTFNTCLCSTSAPCSTPVP